MTQPTTGAARRPATPEELRALANPLRLRIMRLCVDRSLTNKELADRLERDPATVLHHVRKLVAAGFLEPVAVRAGAKGALEKPYRSTGKSWQLDVDDMEGREQLDVAVVEAFRAELLEGGADPANRFIRTPLRLTQESADELERRLQNLVEEFLARDEPDGTPYGLFVGLHVRLT